MMTPEMIDGLSITLVITVACCVLCPILYWILPDRTSHAQLNNESHAQLG